MKYASVDGGEDGHPDTLLSLSQGGSDVNYVSFPYSDHLLEANVMSVG